MEKSRVAKRALEVGTVGQVDRFCQREGAGRDISVGLNHSQVGIARVVGKQRAQQLGAVAPLGRLHLRGLRHRAQQLSRPGDHLVLFPGGKLDHVLRTLPQCRNLALAVLPRNMQGQRPPAGGRPAPPAAPGGTASRKKADSLFARWSPAWNRSVFDREVVFDTLHAHDFAGDRSGTGPLGARVDKAA